MKSKNTDRAEFFFLIRGLARTLNLLDRSSKLCCGLTIAQCVTVETLAQKGPMTLNALSREVGVTESTMSRVLNVLVRDGVAKRKRNSEDRRQIRIDLTAEGKTISERLKKCCEGYLREVLENISERDRKQVCRSLRILNDAVESAKHCCR